MYDRQTESWWQQFTGEGIVGVHTGAQLERLPSRVESFARLHGDAPAQTHGSWCRRTKAPVPTASIPMPDTISAARPFLYRGDLPQGIAPLARVVVVDGEAWSLDLIREAGRYERGDLVITWEAGQNSALDDRTIARGRDIGNVVVQRAGAGGPEDVPHDISFAFAFHAFHPEAPIHTGAE